MTVMTIKQISENVENIEKEKSFEDLMSPENKTFSNDLLLTFTKNSEIAEETITAKLDERLYANLRSAVINAIIALMMVNGRGADLFMASLGDDLVPFVDSVTMAIIGALINEEIL